MSSWRILNISAIKLQVVHSSVELQQVKIYLITTHHAGNTQVQDSLAMEAQKGGVESERWYRGRRKPTGAGSTGICITKKNWARYRTKPRYKLVISVVHVEYTLSISSHFGKPSTTGLSSSLTTSRGRGGSPTGLLKRLPGAAKVRLGREPWLEITSFRACGRSDGSPTASDDRGEGVEPLPLVPRRIRGGCNKPSSGASRVDNEEKELGS